MCMLLIFNIPCHGNLVLAIFITLLQGLVGMCFGKLICVVSFLTISLCCFGFSQRLMRNILLTFYSGLLIATLCDNENSALLLSQASFLPFTVISGVCWPIEGMPFYFRSIAYSMPLTYAIESLRSIFSRGWGVERPDVYAGILISITWIFVLLAMCLIVIRIRKYSSQKKQKQESYNCT